MRKVLLLAVVAGVSMAVLGVGSAAAAACTLVTTSNGESLTVQYYNAPTLTGTLTGGGCDVVAYTDTGTTAISNADISGALKYGVFIDKGATGTISHSSIHDIGSVPFNGVQWGVGVAYRAGSKGTVDSSKIYRYQKNGTVFSGDGTNVNITNSTVSGLGRVSFIAQNGIQYSSGAAGVARGNLVTDNYYTGCSNQDAAKTGCVPYVATGILLYDVDPNAVDTSLNKYRDDQRNLIVYPSSSIH